MKRRQLFKGLAALPLFGILFATNKLTEAKQPEKLFGYADVRDGIWFEAKLPMGHYKFEIEDNAEWQPGKFAKKIIITKVPGLF